MIVHLVDVVHGDIETDDDAALLRQLATKAWELGCRQITGTNDRTCYAMRTPIDQLAMLSLADGVSRSWWRVTTTSAVAR